jgi:hypothetical protein
MIFSWTDIADAVANQVLEIPLVNSLRNNLEALKERFSAEHNWADGTHLWRGAKAFGTGTYSGTYGLVSGSSFNVSSFSRIAAGQYRFTFTTPLAHSYGTVLVSGGSYASLLVLWDFTFDLTTTRCDVYIGDANGAAKDIIASDYVSIAVFQ